MAYSLETPISFTTMRNVEFLHALFQENFLVLLNLKYIVIYF